MSHPHQAAKNTCAASWLTFAVAALGLSTLLALALIASRTPGINEQLPGTAFFHTALSLHVNLSVTVWVLSAGSALMIYLTPAASTLRSSWVALGAAITGTGLMTISPLVTDALPLSNNYIPVLNNTLFICGLMLFALAIIMTASRTLWRLRPWQAEVSQQALQYAVWGAAAAILMAALSAIWALLLTPQILPAKPYFEQIFWAPGHILQLANTLLMLSAWLFLADQWQLTPENHSRWKQLILVLAIVPVFSVPLILFIHPPMSDGFKPAFTELMRWGTWLAALPIGLLLIKKIIPMRTLLPVWHNGLILSVLLFIAGIGLGALIRDDNVMVPAHYHGTVGAVTLALMTLSFHLLAQLRPAHLLPETIAGWQLRCYGYGTLLMASGLALSGWLGVARKQPEAALDNGAQITMIIAGVSGTLAIVGSLLFILLLLPAISGWRLPHAASCRQHAGAPLLLPAFTLAIAAVQLTAFTLTTRVQQHPAAIAHQHLPATQPSSPSQSAQAHERAALKQQLDARFQQAVLMLHAQRYPYAVTALQEVLKLAPNLPEAHTNLGFAFIGLKQYQQAVQAFDRATELKPQQLNAYYGMAEALYELGDIPGALSAMRSYVHRADPESRFTTKAKAAIWEWETELNLQNKNKQSTTR